MQTSFVGVPMGTRIPLTHFLELGAIAFTFRAVRGQKWGFPIDFHSSPYNIPRNLVNRFCTMSQNRPFYMPDSVTKYTKLNLGWSSHFGSLQC